MSEEIGTRTKFKETRYTPTMWQPARENYHKGIRKPPTVYPIIITLDSGGPFSTKKKLQSYIGEDNVLEEPILTIETDFWSREREKDCADAEKDGRRHLRYCTVGYDQFHNIQEQTKDKEIYIWMEENHRVAWEAFSFK